MTSRPTPERCQRIGAESEVGRTPLPWLSECSLSGEIAPRRRKKRAASGAHHATSGRPPMGAKATIRTKGEKGEPDDRLASAEY